MRGENVSSAPIHVRSLMEIASWQWQALMAWVDVTPTATILQRSWCSRILLLASEHKLQIYDLDFFLSGLATFWVAHVCCSSYPPIRFILSRNRRRLLLWHIGLFCCYSNVSWRLIHIIVRQSIVIVPYNYMYILLYNLYTFMQVPTSYILYISFTNFFWSLFCLI